MKQYIKEKHNILKAQNCTEFKNTIQQINNG